MIKTKFHSIRVQQYIYIYIYLKNEIVRIILEEDAKLLCYHLSPK